MENEEITTESSIFWKRFTESGSITPMCDIGYAMFVRDDIIEDEQMSIYGPHKWIYIGTPIHIVDLFEEIMDAWEECPCRDQYGHYESVSGGEIAMLANPNKIVETAGLWDDWDLVHWIWEHVLEPKGIFAIETNDGAIVFDEQLIKRAES